jgi:uncharacterized membrane protein required for colicin V production
MITPFDLILILILFSFGLFGFWFGFIHAIGALIGTAMGAIVASRYYTLWSTSNTTKVVAFLILFTLTDRLVGLAFWGIEKLFNVVKIIPGVTTINRLVGGLFGLIEGAIVLGAALYFIQRFPIGTLPDLIKASDLAHLLLQIGGIVVPLFPQVLRQMQEVGKMLPDLQ